MALTLSYENSIVKSDFLTNTFTASTQLSPDVLGLSNGGFVSAYSTFGNPANFILLDFYNASYNAIGTYKIPYTGTTAAIGAPSLTQLSNGNVLVVWEERDASDPGLRGRIFTAGGNTVGDELKLETSSTDWHDPQVAALADGGFALSFTLSSDSAFVRTFNNAGAFQSGRTVGTGYDTAVAALTDGGYVVTYSVPVDSNEQHVLGRIFNADASLRTDFTVDIEPDNLGAHAKVVGLTNGNFAVVYEDNESDPRFEDKIHPELFDRTGTFQNSELFGYDSPRNPDVTAMPSGTYMVAWDQGTKIFIELLDATGERQLGSLFYGAIALASDASTKTVPAISSMPGGRYVVSWQSGANDGGTGNVGSIHSSIGQVTITATSDSGSDVFVGTPYRETFVGGTGDDRFVYKPGGGADTWTDFVAGSGKTDEIVLSSFAGLHTLQDVLDRTTPSGSNSTIDLGNGDTIYLPGVAKTSLSADDFVLEFFGQPTVKLNAFNPANGWTSQESFPRQLADVNGDGRADIIGFGNGGVYVSLAQGFGNFAAPSVTLNAFNPGNGWTSQNQFHRELADVDSDGLADIVGFGNGGVYVSLATGSGNFAAPKITLNAFNPANGWTSQDQFPRQLADVNGDHHADIVAFGNGGVYVALATTNGNFAAPKIVLNAFNPANGWTNQDQFPRLLGDVNGDGKADIVAFGNGGVYVSLATSDGNFTAPKVTLAALNPANGWTSQNQFTRELADVNADGMADIVGFGNGGVYVALSTGNGNFAAPIVDIAAFNPANGWSGDNLFHREVIEVNSDLQHVADIVGFGNAGVLVAINNGYLT